MEALNGTIIINQEYSALVQHRRKLRCGGKGPHIIKWSCGSTSGGKDSNASEENLVRSFALRSEDLCGCRGGVLVHRDESLPVVSW